MDFFKKSEEHRFQNDLERAKKEHQTQLDVIRAQNLEHLSLKD